jgi:hypothetical protein
MRKIIGKREQDELEQETLQRLNASGEGSFINFIIYHDVNLYVKTFSFGNNPQYLTRKRNKEGRGKKNCPKHSPTKQHSTIAAILKSRSTGRLTGFLHLGLRPKSRC